MQGNSMTNYRTDSVGANQTFIQCRDMTGQVDAKLFPSNDDWLFFTTKIEDKGFVTSSVQ
jgi:hypothetical protein